MSVFVDTGAFVALALRRDDHHAAALRCFERLVKAKTPLITTDWVFGETVSFIRRRAGYGAAREVGERMRQSTALEIVVSNEEVVDRGWEQFLNYRFDDLSLVDCISFVTMRTRRVRQAFTFDGHFAEAGFDLVP